MSPSGVGASCDASARTAGQDTSAHTSAQVAQRATERSPYSAVTSSFLAISAYHSTPTAPPMPCTCRGRNEDCHTRQTHSPRLIPKSKPQCYGAPTDEQLADQGLKSSARNRLANLHLKGSIC